jgi:hypothetical protein
MRKIVLAAAALAFLAASSWSSVQAMPLSASALKGASDAVMLTDKVHCWDDCYYERPRYRSYYRPYYRRYYDDGPYYRSYYRPYVRRYYDDGYYAPRYRAPWWVSGPYYGHSRAFYVGPNVYWY